jgi:hypothetical protein
LVFHNDLFTFQSQSNSKTKADKGNPTSSIAARSSNLDILNGSVRLNLNVNAEDCASSHGDSRESWLLQALLRLNLGCCAWAWVPVTDKNQVLIASFNGAPMHYACLSLSLSPARLQSIGPSCVVVTVNLGTDYDDNVAANQCASGRQALALTKTEQARPGQSYVGTNKH